MIYLDLQSFTEGTIYLDKFDQPAPKSFFDVVKVGDIIKAEVMKVSEGDESSLILLSRLPMIKQAKLDDLVTAQKEKNEVITTVTSVGDKGLVLNYEGFELFLPYSLLDFELQNKKETLLNTNLTVLIEELTRKPRLRIIATRKPIYEKAKQEAQKARIEAREQEIESIKTGDVLEGTVEKIEAHAAHIRFNHILGMLRISQVSHYRIEKIEDELKIGDRVTVKVIKKEGNRLDLSMKSLQKTPYEVYIETHKVGAKVSGVVVQKLPFGIIVELAKDVKGLMHKNEYAWNPKDNFDQYIKIGDTLDLAILSKDPKKERIALSKRALEDNPWLSVDFKYNQDYEVLISNITKEGLVISGQGVEGLIPTQEATVDKAKLDDLFEKGQTVKARVIEFDKDAWVLKLSIKRIKLQEERASFEKYLQEETKESAITLGDLFDNIKKK